jgi:hypothetical protein
MCAEMTDCVAHKSSGDSRVFKKTGNRWRKDPRLCRPVSARSNENMNKNCAILFADRRIITDLLAERLGVCKEAARQIWERDLQKGEIWSSFFFPRSSTTEQGKHRAERCSNFVVCVDLYRGVLQNFLFPKVKLSVEGESFGDISEIRRGVTELLKWFHYRASRVLWRTCTKDTSVIWSSVTIILNVCYMDF